MGSISRLAGKAGTITAAREDSARTWRDTFGTSKETSAADIPRTSNSYTRSATLGNDESLKRLLQAMRSQAPGGWSDNRFEESRHLKGIVYMCINRINEQMAQSEFMVYMRDPAHPEGKRPVQPHEPGFDLVRLLQHPNDEDSFGDLLANWNMQMDLTGMALTWVVPNILGKPMELYPIPTCMALPQAVTSPEYPNGYYRIQPIYPYGPFTTWPTPALTVGAAIPREWMMRMKYTHPFLRYEGLSPQTALNLQIDSVEAIDQSRMYSMRKSVDPSGVLNADPKEGGPIDDTEVDRIHAEWRNKVQGPHNHGGLIVNTLGGKLEAWGNKPLEMDWPEGWGQLTSFVMAGFGITKPAAGMIEDASYASLFATLKQLHLLTIKPKLDRIAARLTRFLAKFFGDDLIIEIKAPRIDDHDIDFQKVDRGIAAKCIRKNEVRKLLGLPPTQESWGDEMAGPDEKMMEGVPGSKPGTPITKPGSLPERQLDRDTQRSQPKPGALSRGALGPRDKLLYMATNGNGRH